MTETISPTEPGHPEPGPTEPGPPEVGPSELGHPEPGHPEPARPEPAGVTEPGRMRPPYPSHSSRPTRVLTAIGFLLLAGGLFYVWYQQQTLNQPIGVDPARVAGLETELRSLQQRVGQLEQRPAPSPAPAADLRPLAARITALEQRPAAEPAAQPDLGPLADRIEALDRSVSQAATAAAAAGKLADGAVRIEAATAALAAGQPLGVIPNAPAALTRFASEKPPTEAELRLSFPAAASRAAEASRPPAGGQSMTDRMWQRFAALITVRSGDRVIIGAPAGPVLEAARVRLDAGDLAGAVAALDALDPDAAQAMADWRARAQSLLDARAALASLAHG